jgi:hypothetical protein
VLSGKGRFRVLGQRWLENDDESLGVTAEAFAKNATLRERRPQMNGSLPSFLAGFSTALYLVAGLLFLRFWRRTRDRIFVAFALAFWLLAFSQTLSQFVEAATDEHAAILLARVAAFCVIIAGIVAKNVSRLR